MLRHGMGWVSTHSQTAYKGSQGHEQDSQERTHQQASPGGKVDAGQMRYRKRRECRGKQSREHRAGGTTLAAGHLFLHSLSTATRELLGDSTTITSG
ncbi:MAG TPA: hypothetical protein VFM77_12505 [Terriglobales bacterium]|nr:hypothetical protein [Terriglobales bacterium]